MMEILTAIASALLPFIGGYYVGHQRGRKHESYGQIELRKEDAHELVNAYLRSRLRHPSMRNRHPEMDDDE